MKRCKKCKLEKPLNEFSKDKSRKDKINTKCKSCSKKYVIKNKEHIKERSKIYDKEYNLKNKDKIKLYINNNKERILKYSSNYYKNNKKKHLEYNKAHSKDRRKIDINFKLRGVLSNRLYVALKNQNLNKGLKTMNLLGCSIKDLKDYISKQFKPEMTWDNYGKIWQIDHILPCVYFNLVDIEQQKICFHYTNLQPLFSTTEIAESLGYKDYIGNQNKKDKII